MCLYPKLIKNPKYKENAKNGGLIPPVTDLRTLYLPIGCKQCIECRKQKTNNWKTRLMEDIKQFKNARFVTLTFSNENYTKIAEELILNTPKGQETPTGYVLDNLIAIRAVRLFTENWRKKYQKTLRHWLVTELGHNGTENIHLHGLVWCNDFLERTVRKKKIVTYWKDEIKNTWAQGYVWLGQYVNERTINYITKYVTKVDPKHKYYEPIILTSKGIGANYINSPGAKLNQYQDGKTRDYYTTRAGNKISLPTYWRNKIYTDDEKEKLWIEKLDKEERWVMGTKVDVSRNFKEYLEALRTARKYNRKHGYGTGDRDINQEEYERQMRTLKQLTRMKHATETEKLQISINPNDYDQDQGDKARIWIVGG